MPRPNRMRIAFLYNVWHKYPDPDDPKTQLEADFDDRETINGIISHLKKIGHVVIPIEANERAYLKLYRYKKEIDMAFDFSFGLHGIYKYGHIPSMLEMLQIPFVGSSSFTRALTLNKVKMKQILMANGVSTLPYQVFRSDQETIKSPLSFPLIVKPIAQGSSAGILNKSVVHNPSELREQVRFIIRTFGQPAFVEPFLRWREFSVSLLGNPPQLLPVIEPNFALLPKRFNPIDSLEIKWIYEEQPGHHHLTCPAKVDRELFNRIKSIALRTWEVLEVRDLCRIDMRTDQKDNLYVLDVNCPPGLIPPSVSMTSYLPLAARAAGIDYDTMLKMIIDAAKKRYAGGR